MLSLGSQLSFCLGKVKGKWKSWESLVVRQKALMLCELCPKSRRNFIGNKKVGSGRNKGRREMNRNPSRDKRKCRLCLCSVRNWWPNVLSAPSQSLDKTTWATLASLLLHDLVHKWVWPLPCYLQCCLVLPWTWPSCVWHIPALPKHSQEVLRTQALCCSTWEEMDLQLFRLMLVRAVFKKKQLGIFQ